MFKVKSSSISRCGDLWHSNKERDGLYGIASSTTLSARILAGTTQIRPGKVLHVYSKALDISDSKFIHNY